MTGEKGAWCSCTHDGRTDKKILRAAARDLVPRDILDRPKNGFGTPAAAWLRGPLREMTHELLLGPGSLAADREEGELVELLLDEHRRGIHRSAELWTLLALEQWRDAVDVPVVRHDESGRGAVLEPQQRMAERSLVILLVDPEGRRSPIAAAVRWQGHRVVITTGIETAQMVLGTLLPDVTIVRSVSSERDRQTVARLERIAPEIPVRVLEAPAGLDAALDMGDASSVLN